MNLAATVTPDNVDYTMGGDRDLTQTPDGRLRVEATVSAQVQVGQITAGNGLTAIVPSVASRKYLLLMNTGSISANITIGNNATTIPLAPGGFLFGGVFAPSQSIYGGTGFSTTTILYITA